MFKEFILGELMKSGNFNNPVNTDRETGTFIIDKKGPFMKKRTSSTIMRNAAGIANPLRTVTAMDAHNGYHRFSNSI